jgi:hypothetical protein
LRLNFGSFASRLVNLIEQAALAKKFRLRFFPAPKNFVHREEGNAGQLGRVILQDRGVARPVMMLRGSILRLGGEEKFQVSLGGFPRAFFVNDRIDHSSRRLAQNAGRGINDVEFIFSEFFLCQPELIFPVQQDVAKQLLVQSPLVQSPFWLVLGLCPHANRLSSRPTLKSFESSF